MPGTLTAPPGTPSPPLALLAYGPERLHEQELGSLETLDALEETWPVTWLDIHGPATVDMLNDLGRRFELHPLALEDVCHFHQRVKVDDYGHHLYMVIRMPAETPAGGIDSEQVSIFLCPGHVITFQERPGDCLEPVRNRIRNATGRIRKLGPDYLAYAIIDAIVDHYFPLLESFGDQLEELEEEVLGSPGPGTMADIHDARHQLLALRRQLWPLRDALGTLVREEWPLIDAGTQPFLRDCMDHSLSVIDMVETYRELVSGFTDLYLSAQSHRMNEVMKVLTIIATIFIPLGFLAGVYGMNFDAGASPWNMPELGWRYGYPLCLGLMATIGLTMLAWFWRKGWLSS